MNEALATPARGIAVACPFSVTMFEDGVRALDAEERFAVRDLSEIVADSLDGAASAARRAARGESAPPDGDPV